MGRNEDHLPEQEVQEAIQARRTGIMLTEKEMSDYFDSLPDDKRDGLSKAQFMQEIKRIMDPKANGRILNKMVEMRGREACARANKAAIDRASRNRSIGLR
jgi:hypothetical protein